jgi:4,5-dihydroxyphthalate decarboxylase
VPDEETDMNAVTPPADRAITLTAAIGPHPHTDPLTSGRVEVPGARLEFAEVTPIIAAFRRMVRSLEFDVCELAPTTYLAAREAGVPLTAIPVFLGREFHFDGIVCGEGSGIEKPEDLTGRRVGVRAYTVSTGVWARAMLRSEYGVDPNSITWIVDDEEHVASYRLPANVIHAPHGASLASLFESGEIDAAFAGPAGIGRSGPPRAGWDTGGTELAKRGSYALFPETGALERAYYRSTGVYPMHGLIALKTAVLATRPELSRTLREAFETAKQPFLDRLRAGEPAANAGAEKDFAHYSAMRAVIDDDDPLPYGIEANRRSIEALIEAAFDQKIVSSRPKPEELFAE